MSSVSDDSDSSFELDDAVSSNGDLSDTSELDDDDLGDTDVAADVETNDTSSIELNYDSSDSSSCCSISSSDPGCLGGSTSTSEYEVWGDDSSDDSDSARRQLQKQQNARNLKRAASKKDVLFRGCEPPNKKMKGLKGLCLQMHWSSGKVRMPRKSKWQKVRRGGIVHFHKDTPSVVIFHTIIEDAIKVWMVNTNKKASEIAVEKNAQFRSMDFHDVCAYLSDTLWMDTSRLPELADYWSTDEFIGDNFVKRVAQLSGMSHRRYVTVTQCTRLYDKEEAEENGWNDKKSQSFRPAYRVQPFMDAFNLSCQREVVPNRYVSVDEAVDKFTGRFSSRQYMPRKPNNTGIKTYNAACARSSYQFYSMLHVADQKFPFSEMGMRFSRTWAIVSGSELPGGISFLDRHLTLYFDRWYTSVELFWELLHRQTYAVGTVSTDRTMLPPDVCNKRSEWTSKKNFPRGNAIFRHTTDGKMSLVVWKDKALVSVLYTDPSCIEQIGLCTRGDKDTDNGLVLLNRPTIIHEYNERMAGVDLNDQMNAAQYRHRRSSFWYHVVKNRHIRVAATNTRAVLSIMGITIPMLNLKRQLAEDLAKWSIRPNPTTGIRTKLRSSPTSARRRNDVTMSCRLDTSVVHAPAFVPSSERERCRMHTTARRKTSMKCATCDAFLCKGTDCWTRWHSDRVV